MRDITQLSNEELMGLAGSNQPATPDVTKLSNEDLMRIAAQHQQMQPPPQTSAARTMLEQGLQGLTSGFGDEIANGLGAVGASIITGEPLKNLYKEATDESKRRLAAEMQQRPITSLASNIAGAVLTGGAGATTKAGTAVANSLRSGNLAARIGKSAVAGAASGGLYGAGTADEGQRLAGAGKGAFIGGVLGAAAPVAGAAANSAVEGGQNILKGMVAKSADALDAVEGNIKTAGSGFYKQMRDAGAEIKPTAINSLTSDITGTIKKEIGTLDPELHKSTISVLQGINNEADKGELSLQVLDQKRRLLSRISRTGEDSAAAQEAIDVIDKHVNKWGADDLTKGTPEAIDALNNARQYWSSAKKFEIVSDIIKKAAGDPDKIKNGLWSLYNNDKKIGAFSPSEREALQEAATRSGGEYLLKGLGRFGIEPKNVYLPFVGGGITAATVGNPAAIALVGGGTIARQANKYLVRGKAEELARVLENGTVQKNIVPPNTLPPQPMPALKQKAQDIAEILSRTPNLTGLAASYWPRRHNLQK